MRNARGWVFALLAALVLAAPALAPYDPARQFDRYAYAPPMRPHVMDDEGRWHLPFAYPIRVVDPLERRYAEDRARRLSFRADEPWFVLGSDSLGRDVFSRVLTGARLSLGVALLSTGLALLIGALVGASAGYGAGWTDGALMRIADFVLLLPVIYLVLALRGAMPLFLTDAEMFATLVVVFSVVGWPSAARGVRGIVVGERHAEYAEAARAIGAGRMRVIVKHLMPATSGFLAVQSAVLVPAFIMAEATLSFVGLGFSPPAPSWGAMLQDAQQVSTLADAPWLLVPAAAIVVTVFVVHTVCAPRDPLLWDHNNS